MRRLILIAGLFMLVACSPTITTPVVIPDNSAAMTRTALVQPAASPTGPTPVPSITPTPYTRPTDDPALALDTPIVKVGDQTVTLGQYRQRVRYERFAALDNARVLIERVGINKLLSAPTSDNQTLVAVASIFNTLSNSANFGEQIYDVMVREQIIWQEAKTRGLSVSDAELRNYWIKQLDLQDAANPGAVLPQALDAYLAKATGYSGLTNNEIIRIAHIALLSDKLRNIIGKENFTAPSAVRLKIHRIVTKTKEDADAALKRLQQGEDFRTVACEVSIDPTVRGTGGDLGSLTKANFVAGLQNVDQIFGAAKGDMVGPLQSQQGWYLFSIKDTRKNADGDTEVDAQGILVATESLANDLKSRLQNGESFGKLACLYSLDKNAGNGGDLGLVDPSAVSPEAAAALQKATGQGLLGPFALNQGTLQGFEIVRLDDRQLNILKPEDLERMETQAYLDWQDAKVKSNFVQVQSDNWRNAIPTDPLPRDVSPLMVEQNFGLPTPIPTASTAVVPTATP